jgi:hypothetical protein
VEVPSFARILSAWLVTLNFEVLILSTTVEPSMVDPVVGEVTVIGPDMPGASVGAASAAAAATSAPRPASRRIGLRTAFMGPS